MPQFFQPLIHNGLLRGCWAQSVLVRRSHDTIIPYCYNIATMTQISIRLPDREIEHLQAYCKLTGRTQSDVIRELLRKLSVSGVLNPID
ncbi:MULTISPECIES: ribbon-helix-helix protein, CopG family [Cyanophyceae]